MPGEPSACSSTLIASVCDLLHARKVVDSLLRKLEAQRPSENNLSQEDKHATPTGLLARRKEGPYEQGQWESLSIEEKVERTVLLARLIAKAICPQLVDEAQENNHEQ